MPAPKTTTLAEADALLEREATRQGITKAQLLRRMAAKEPAGPLVGVRMPPEMKTWVEREAEATGQSQQDVIRQAIEIHMHTPAAVRRQKHAAVVKG